MKAAELSSVARLESWCPAGACSGSRSGRWAERSSARAATRAADRGRLRHGRHLPGGEPGLLDAFGTVSDSGPTRSSTRVPGGPEGRPSGGRPRLRAWICGMATARAIVTRRSTRAYAPLPMTLEGNVATTGPDQRHHGRPARQRAARGTVLGGAVWIELYPVVHRVEGIEPGVYHYAYREHALEQVRAGDFQRRSPTKASPRSSSVSAASCCSSRWCPADGPKYQDRSYRYGLLEAGHVGEKRGPGCRIMGLGACGIGAFMDDQ